MLRRATLLLVLSGLLLTGLTAVAAPTAVADGCWAENEEGELVYVCDDDGNGGGGDDGDGGGGGPSCDLGMIDREGVHDGAHRWCEGQNACWANIPALTEDEDEADTPKPDPDAVWIYKVCYAPDGSTTPSSGWQWYVPQVLSLAELAAIAYGRLVTPPFTLATSPRDSSVVNLATWWWADGAGDGEIIGTAALGVRAVGTPSHLELVPGDDPDRTVITCPWSVEESPRCSSTYRRETTGGAPYLAEARVVYDVRFEQNGAPLELPGLPTSLASAWVEREVVVDEIGALVVR